MSDSTVRGFVFDYLRPLIPADWRIVPGDMPDTLDRITLSLHHQSIKRLPEAPSGSLVNDLEIHVATPQRETGRAEDELDEGVHELAHVLNRADGLVWTGAEKVLLGNAQHLAWRISVQVLSTPDSEEE